MIVGKITTSLYSTGKLQSGENLKQIDYSILIINN
jgi:hypothetical protein